MIKHSKLPWAITSTPRGAKQITDDRGGVVANLTALDMSNAELIVECVNDAEETLHEVAYQSARAIIRGTTLSTIMYATQMTLTKDELIAIIERENASCEALLTRLFQQRTQRPEKLEGEEA